MSLSSLIRSCVILRIVAIGFVLFCLVLVTGCPERSLNGLDESGNDPDMVFDSRLVGTWPTVAEKCTSGLTITAHEKVYSLQFMDCESNKKTSYEAHLFKLDQHYFLDMTAPSDEVCDLCIALHTYLLGEVRKGLRGAGPARLRLVQNRRGKEPCQPYDAARRSRHHHIAGQGSEGLLPSIC